jgi:hypothetical protein
VIKWKSGVLDMRRRNTSMHWGRNCYRDTSISRLVRKRYPGGCSHAASGGLCGAWDFIGAIAFRSLLIRWPQRSKLRLTGARFV